MTSLSERISALHLLGKVLKNLLQESNTTHTNQDSEFENVVLSAFYHNKWFTDESVKMSLNSISDWLNDENLRNWANSYLIPEFTQNPKRVGIIMAGNIPLVGFHDLLCVLITGNIAVVKLSSQDRILNEFLLKHLTAINPEVGKLVEIQENLVKNIDAIIATGSNNSARYFEYYFSKYPHIIRKHRNSVAVLRGNENSEQLEKLADDIFLYFGLGCRNVSKIFVPEHYDFKNLMLSFEKYNTMHQHTKYFNNYEYNKSIFLINGVKHLDNGFVLLTENSSLFSPVAVLYFEYYSKIEDVVKQIDIQSDSIQCVVSDLDFNYQSVKFGDAQFPGLDEFSDNINTIEFLKKL